MVTQEKWMSVKGFNGIYEVSNNGRIKSIERVVNGKNGSKRLIKEKILSPGKSKNGYLLVKLYSNKNSLMVYVHRIVAAAFIKNNGGNHINHIDFNTCNNHVNNLEWVTHKENIEHASAAGNMKIKLSINDDEEIKRLYENGMPQNKIAKIFSVTPQAIWYVLDRYKRKLKEIKK